MGKKMLIKKAVSRCALFSREIGLVVLLGALIACGEDPQQLFETAQFEEQQHNQAHARELYERILRDHPKSTIVGKAQQRLNELKKENP